MPLKRRRQLLALVLLGLLWTSCDRSLSSVGCLDPPQSAFGVVSDFELVIEPYPVMAGTLVTITVNGDGLDRSLNGGLGASWECWDGAAWVQTHVIVRGSQGLPPAAVELSTDPTVAIPDIGLAVPNSHEIVIPLVDPGTYRITDYLYGPEMSLTAHVVVEVVGSQE